MQERDVKGDIISLVGQFGIEVPEKKTLVNMYNIQLTGNIGPEFQKERRAGGYKSQEALR